MLCFTDGHMRTMGVQTCIGVSQAFQTQQVSTSQIPVLCLHAQKTSSQMCAGLCPVLKTWQRQLAYLHMRKVFKMIEQESEVDISEGMQFLFKHGSVHFLPIPPEKHTMCTEAGGLTGLYRLH